MKIKPFRALRPLPEYASRVASAPYDAVSRREAAALAADNPFSFLHVTRAEIDLPDEVGSHSAAVYEKALANFLSLRSRRILVEDGEECLYVYRITAGEHVQTGIAACCSVDDYAGNVIRRHEKTREAKETDRARLTSKLGAHTGPVLLAYKDRRDIEDTISRIEKENPMCEVRGRDGTVHTIRRVPGRDLENTNALVEGFGRVPVSYIADGHHRAAANLRVATERRAASRRIGAESDWFPAILFPMSRLRIFPYNRYVRDLAGMTARGFLDAVRSVFTVTANASAAPDRAGHISMYLSGQWYGLSCGTGLRYAGAAATLDAEVLQARLLEPILHVRDPRTDPRVEHINGTAGTDALRALVDSGHAAVAFSMYPVSMDQLTAIADAGSVMPPKSTWFAPKPMSGLLVHAF